MTHVKTRNTLRDSRAFCRLRDVKAAFWRAHKPLRLLHRPVRGKRHTADSPALRHAWGAYITALRDASEYQNSITQRLFNIALNSDPRKVV